MVILSSDNHEKKNFLVCNDTKKCMYDSYYRLVCRN